MVRYVKHDPRKDEDLHLPGLAQQVRLANVYLRSAPTLVAVKNILQPIANRLDDARRWATLHGDTGRALAAERALKEVWRKWRSRQ